MNKVSKFLAPVAMAAAALWAPNASAGLVFNGTYQSAVSPPTNTTYIGTYVSTNYDAALFNHSMTASGSFTDTWVFDFNPIGSATTNANFTPPNTISNFTVKLFNATASCSTVGAACASYSQGSLIATGIPGTSSSDIGFIGLGAGFYSIQVTGTVGVLALGASSLYSGQLATSPIPEPASLALVGVALLGLALSGKKRKSV